MPTQGVSNCPRALIPNLPGPTPALTLFGMMITSVIFSRAIIGCPSTPVIIRKSTSSLLRHAFNVTSPGNLSITSCNSGNPEASSINMLFSKFHLPTISRETKFSASFLNRWQLDILISSTPGRNTIATNNTLIVHPNARLK